MKLQSKLRRFIIMTVNSMQYSFTVHDIMADIIDNLGIFSYDENEYFRVTGLVRYHLNKLKYRKTKVENYNEYSQEFRWPE